MLRQVFAAAVTSALEMQERSRSAVGHPKDLAFLLWALTSPDSLGEEGDGGALHQSLVQRALALLERRVAVHTFSGGEEAGRSSEREKQNFIPGKALRTMLRCLSELGTRGWRDAMERERFFRLVHSLGSLVAEQLSCAEEEIAAAYALAKLSALEEGTAVFPAAGQLSSSAAVWFDALLASRTKRLRTHPCQPQEALLWCWGAAKLRSAVPHLDWPSVLCRLEHDASASRVCGIVHAAGTALEGANTPPHTAVIAAQLPELYLPAAQVRSLVGTICARAACLRDLARLSATDLTNLLWGLHNFLLEKTPVSIPTGNASDDSSVVMVLQRATALLGGRAAAFYRTATLVEAVNVLHCVCLFRTQVSGDHLPVEVLKNFDLLLAHLLRKNKIAYDVCASRALLSFAAVGGYHAEHVATLVVEDFESGEEGRGVADRGVPKIAEKHQLLDSLVWAASKAGARDVLRRLLRTGVFEQTFNCSAEETTSPLTIRICYAYVLAMLWPPLAALRRFVAEERGVDGSGMQDAARNSGVKVQASACTFTPEFRAAGANANDLVQMRTFLGTLFLEGHRGSVARENDVSVSRNQQEVAVAVRAVLGARHFAFEMEHLTPLLGLPVDVCISRRHPHVCRESGRGGAR